MALFLWLIAIPVLASPVVYLAGRLAGAAIARWLAFLALAVTCAPFVLAAQDLAASGPATFTLGLVKLKFDGLSLLLAALALGLGTCVTLFSNAYMRGEIGEEKYYAALLAMIGVIVGLGCANDLFNLWIWFEAMAVSSYMLVAFYRDQPASLEAGVKYLVQSAVGSVLVMLGIAAVFGATGELSLEGIADAAQASSVGLLAAGGLMTVGFGVKAALVPLHTWLPDAHSQAPSGISAMLSGVVIEAGLIALLRAVSPLLGAGDSVARFGQLLLLFAALNMILGNLLALKQTQVKRMLAFSSLSHMGYMLLGFGVAAYTGQATAAQGGAFHMLSHGLMKGLAFLAAGALLHTLYLANGAHGPLTVSDLNGAARRYPLTALALGIAVLGLAGLPPLVGFMSKWQIFVGGFQAGDTLTTLLVIFAALNSVLSLAYYAPLVNAMYRREISDAVRRGKAMPLTMIVPLVVMSILVIALGVWPTLVEWLTGPAGLALMAGR
ncbi:MAG: complex I subunit 5 family protein [Anaerolineae bacterium]